MMKKIFIKISKSFMVYILSVICSFIVGFFLDINFSGINPSGWNSTPEDLMISDRMLNLLNALPLLFLYYTFTRTFFIAGADERSGYLKSNLKAVNLGSKFYYTIRSQGFIIQAAVSLLSIIIFPVSFGYSELINGIFFDMELTAGVEKLFSIIICVPIMLILTLLSHVSAVTEWEHQRTLLEFNVKEKAYGTGFIIKTLILSMLIYCAVFFMIPYFFPIIYTLLRIGQGFIIQFIVLTVIIVISFLGFNYIKAILKRRDFRNKLYKLCEEKGFEVHNFRKPYAAIFREHEGISFTVTANGNIYDCKLLAAVRPNTCMIVSRDGGAWRHTYSIFNKELFHKYGGV